MATNNKQNNVARPKFRVGDALWTNIFRKTSGETETTLAILRRIPLFLGMRKSELLEFEKLMHRREYREDETVFYEGEPGVGMYIVQEGSVLIYKDKADGAREVLAELSSGEFFGDLALLDESPRSASAVAREDSKVLGLFRPDLLELIERKPRLGNKLLFQLAQMIGERLKHTNDELQTLWSRLDESSKVIT